MSQSEGVQINSSKKEEEETGGQGEDILGNRVSKKVKLVILREETRFQTQSCPNLKKPHYNWFGEFRFNSQSHP